MSIEKVKYVYKSFSYRIYPNKKQTDMLEDIFDAGRIVYNDLLELKINQYKNNKRNLSRNYCINYYHNVLLKEKPELELIPQTALINVIYTLNETFNKNIRKNKFPKFKKQYAAKKTFKLFTVNDLKLDFEKNKIYIKPFKSIKTKLHREFEGKIKHVIFKKENDHYHVIFVVKAKHEILHHSKRGIGIDLGLKDLVITSNGERYYNQKIFYHYEKKLKRLNKELSQKEYNSKNYLKTKNKINKTHRKIKNLRKNNLNQISSKLIKENDYIIAEDIDILKLIKTHNLSKSLIDASWNELLRQLEYKAKWNNKVFYKIDRYYPSSQLCSKCHKINPRLKDVNIRKWTCPNCGEKHDRDINAAKNILYRGLKDLHIY